jgi:5-methylcytosine-specific restriction endonuclease McrA
MSKRKRHWELIVGYTLSELKSYLEKKFKLGMTWDNYGSLWHIDHIIPRSSFSYDSLQSDSFKKCWSLSNLQPLWKQENLSKGTRPLSYS